VALASVERLSFRYPGAERAALEDVSLVLEEGEAVALLGPSGAGKSTLVRALAGLVPHFHGGAFAGRVAVAGRDTRRARPAELAGTVATVFQDPEDQIVMGLVANEIAFGLENVGTPAGEILSRVEEALAAVGALHLAGRRTSELSGGEQQRVCLAAALALRPRLLLLDEPTSQLDPAGAEAFLAAVEAQAPAVLLSEQRVERALALTGRVLFLHGGTLVLDAPRAQASAWLAREQPDFVAAQETPPPAGNAPGEPVVAAHGVSFAYGGMPVLDGVSIEVRRGEVVVLEGPNGAGKTTLARIAAGLLAPDGGSVERAGRAAYLSQDPGRYLVRDRADDEVALAVRGDRERARRALAEFGLQWAAARHPRDLSSGERERLALAAVAVAEADLLVLDEPTRGMDPVRKRRLGEWARAYADEGRGVLVATHDCGFPADRRVSLAAGEAALV
jgi:energy-coupling factor transporter ATP-binding protein EcfA2